MENNMKIRITFMEEVLGSSPAKQEIYRDYIASKAPDAATIEDEVAAVGVDEVTEQGMTVFPRTKDGVPFAYDYQIKGMFKDTCGMLARVKTTESSKLKAYKKIIDGLIFVYPREIPYQFDGEIGKCDRPLRAQTAQGERVAIPLNLKWSAWIQRTKKRFLSGWNTVKNAASLSGETPEKADLPLK